MALVSALTPESGVTASSHTHSWIDPVFAVFALDKLAFIKLVLLIQQHKDHSTSPWARRVKYMLITVREMYPCRIGNYLSREWDIQATGCLWHHMNSMKRSLLFCSVRAV